MEPGLPHAAYFFLYQTLNIFLDFHVLLVACSFGQFFNHFSCSSIFQSLESGIRRIQNSFHPPLKMKLDLMESQNHIEYLIIYSVTYEKNRYLFTNHTLSQPNYPYNRVCQNCIFSRDCKTTVPNHAQNSVRPTFSSKYSESPTMKKVHPGRKLIHKGD